MARSCSICTGGLADRVDELLARGVSQRKIATLCGVTYAKVRVHASHADLSRFKTQESKTEETKEIEKTGARAFAGDNVETQLRAQIERLNQQIHDAFTTGNVVMQLRYETQLQKTLSLLAEIETPSQPTNLNADLNRQISLLVSVITNELGQYPEAQNRIVRALKQFTGDNPE